jgi:solute carrier family 8 (sodium/calcium exchanger)
MDTERDTKLQFAQTSLIVKESVGMIRVSVVRRGNTKLRASVNWTTVAETARDGRDFIGGSGQLEFDVGEVEKQIPILILDDKVRKQNALVAR